MELMETVVERPGRDVWWLVCVHVVIRWSIWAGSGAGSLLLPIFLCCLVCTCRRLSFFAMLFVYIVLWRLVLCLDSGCDLRTLSLYFSPFLFLCISCTTFFFLPSGSVCLTTLESNHVKFSVFVDC